MKSILLVEPNKSHAEMFRVHLEKKKYDVVECNSLSQTKSKLQDKLPDFIVIDLILTETEFHELYHWILDSVEISKIPRLFLAGKLQAQLAEKLKVEQNETVLVKPINITRLITHLEKEKIPVIDKTFDLSRYNLHSFIGKKIGSAVIKEEIGRGGMGAVFLGYQESLHRQVAVKLLLPGMVGDKNATERFKREARAIAKLKSPHIVQIFDFAELENHVFYIIMEFLPGNTLDRYLKGEGRAPKEMALSIVKQVASGLVVAHNSSLVHRDIKPSNLIMNETGHVTITDFGLVKPQQKVDQTQPGMIFGSPRFMSPEQVSGDTVDSRSDIYSLGIVFYYLLVGKPPFTSEKPMELMMKHLKEHIPNPREYVDDIPPLFVKVLQKMTAKNAENRHSNCQELLADFEKLQKNLKTSTITEKINQIEITKGYLIPSGLMQNIELELARFIGPIAKILLDKEIKKLGLTRDTFPSDSMLDLSGNISRQIDKTKRQSFIDKVQDILYEHRRKTK